MRKIIDNKLWDALLFIERVWQPFLINWVHKVVAMVTYSMMLLYNMKQALLCNRPLLISLGCFFVKDSVMLGSKVPVK